MLVRCPRVDTLGAMADGASIALFSLHQRDAALDLRERLVREIGRAHV